MTRPDHPRPEVVAALAEAWSKHSTISDRPWSTIEHQMEDFIAAIPSPFAIVDMDAHDREVLDAAHRRYHGTTLGVARCDCDPYTWDPSLMDEG